MRDLQRALYGRVQISNGGGASPNWSRTVDELLYLAGTQIMARSVGNAFALAPDDKRAVLVVPQEPHENTRSSLLHNFFDELRRRVPLPR